MNTLLDKLNGLEARFEEVSTLITDPNVIGDQKRYVRLTKEYKELEDLMAARKEYANLLSNLEESKDMLLNETDAEMKDMAREEVAECEKRIPELEERIKLMLVPKDPEDAKNAILEIRGGTGGDEAALLPATCSACTANTASVRAGNLKCQVPAREPQAVLRKLSAPLRAPTCMAP